jgi:hypothetical protein
MRNWIFASIAILILLVGFAFSVYYFYKQKFLVEVQKILSIMLRMSLARRCL